MVNYQYVYISRSFSNKNTNKTQINVNVPPSASAHDGACQVFAQLYGGCVYYGDNCRRKSVSYEPALPNWSSSAPIVLVCYGHSAMIAQKLQYLLEEDFWGKGTNASWIRAIVNVAGTLNGTPLLGAVGVTANDKCMSYSFLAQMMMFLLHKLCMFVELCGLSGLIKNLHRVFIKNGTNSVLHDLSFEGAKEFQEKYVKLYESTLYLNFTTNINWTGCISYPTLNIFQLIGNMYINFFGTPKKYTNKDADCEDNRNNNGVVTVASQQYPYLNKCEEYNAKELRVTESRKRCTTYVKVRDCDVASIDDGVYYYIDLCSKNIHTVNNSTICDVLAQLGICPKTTDTGGGSTEECEQRLQVLKDSLIEYLMFLVRISETETDPEIKQRFADELTKINDTLAKYDLVLSPPSKQLLIDRRDAITELNKFDTEIVAINAALDAPTLEIRKAEVVAKNSPARLIQATYTIGEGVTPDDIEFLKRAILLAYCLNKSPSTPTNIIGNIYTLDNTSPFTAYDTSVAAPLPPNDPSLPDGDLKEVISIFSDNYILFIETLLTNNLDITKIYDAYGVVQAAIASGNAIFTSGSYNLDFKLDSYIIELANMSTAGTPSQTLAAIRGNYPNIIQSYISQLT